MMLWNADLYESYGQERLQPALDLLNRVPDGTYSRIIDIGCGSGMSTLPLERRFPEAEIFGVDFSDEMLQKARQRSDKIRWIQRDCSQPLADLGKFDLVFSNAFLQWLPNQEDFLASIVSLLNETGLFAVQVPNYDHMPVKHCVDKTAALFGHLFQNQDLTVCHNRCLPEYYDILCEHYGEVTIWKTDYVHVLDDHQSIVDFVSATGIRPYLQVLNREEQSAFVQALLAELEQAYPTQKNGKVLFAFERIEFLAKR